MVHDAIAYAPYAIYAGYQAELESEQKPLRFGKLYIKLRGD
jgi:hypothetical protein